MQQSDVVSVIGCGPSALQCGGARAPGYRIAINAASEYVEHDAVITMDGRYAREKPEQFRNAPESWIRSSAWEHIVRKHLTTSRWKGLHVFACDRETSKFGLDPEQLNGSNSGYCALNLAFVMRPKRVYLYGFDMNKPTHFFGQYPWHMLPGSSTNCEAKFRVWRNEMYHARQQFDAAGIEVFNTNTDSKVQAFKFGRPSCYPLSP